jgi:hypothetical protein
VPVIFCQKCGTKNQIGEELRQVRNKAMILAYAHRMNSTFADSGRAFSGKDQRSGIQHWPTG